MYLANFNSLKNGKRFCTLITNLYSVASINKQPFKFETFAQCVVTSRDKSSCSYWLRSLICPLVIFHQLHATQLVRLTECLMNRCAARDTAVRETHGERDKCVDLFCVREIWAALRRLLFEKELLLLHNKRNSHIKDTSD